MMMANGGERDDSGPLLEFTSPLSAAAMYPGSAKKHQRDCSSLPCFLSLLEPYFPGEEEYRDRQVAEPFLRFLSPFCFPS